MNFCKFDDCRWYACEGSYCYLHTRLRIVEPISNENLSPQHYKTASGIEAWDVIEAFELGFNLGNTIKYILRAGKKGNRKEDLQKAQVYLLREIEKS